MKVSYTRETDEPVKAFGATFEPGKGAEVDERYRAKVEGNPFFSIGGAAEKQQQPSSQTGTLEAKHRGGGSYSIMQGDTELVEKISKQDADAFNAMSDEDKAAYVADKQ